MATLLTGNFNDLVDGKFLILKRMPSQPEPGTMIHVMGASQDQSGAHGINYRVTETGQNYTATFRSMKEFYAWARPDSFIARNYESFTKHDVQKYIRVKKRTPASFCLPLIAVMLVVVWALMLILLDAPLSIIFGALLSIVGAFGIFMLYKRQKERMKMKMYGKIVTKWGIEIK